MALDKDNAQAISEIKTALIKHYADDEKEFQSINNKLDNLKTAMNQDDKDREASHELIHKECRMLRQDIKELSDKVTPVVSWFDNINFGKKALMFILAFLGSILGLAIGLKNLLK